MKLIYVYVAAAVLLLSLPSIAQKSKTEPNQQAFKRLYIGDTVPMESIVFNNVRNYPGGKAKLSDFKGKYIILDFWTKGCSSCIAAFPHMQELQQQFKDDIQILLVTQNTEEELALLFKNSPNLKNTTLPVVIGEHVLTEQLFPNGSVPYHVWLNKEGEVLATTFQQETTSKNLKDLIAGKPLNILVKNELPDEALLSKEIDPRKSFLEIGNGRFLSYLRYYEEIPNAKKINDISKNVITFNNLQESLSRHSQIAANYSLFMNFLPIEGYDPDKFFLDENGKQKGFRLFNISLDDLYRLAYTAPYSKVKKIVPEGRAKLFYEEMSDSTNEKRYRISNGYCYESSLLDYSLERATKLLQCDLIRFIGMEGSIEEKPVKHLVLTKLPTFYKKNLWAKDQNFNVGYPELGQRIDDGFIFKNSSLTGLKTGLQIANRETDDPIILIDEKEFTKEERSKGKNMKNVLLKCSSLKCSIDNLPIIQRELAQYGLSLKEEIRTIKVLVLRAVI